MDAGGPLTGAVAASTVTVDADLLSLLLHYHARVHGVDIHSLTLEDAMGMYDKDPNFEAEFKEGDRFVITGMQYIGDVNTVHGSAQKTLITIVTRESYADGGKQVTYSALGAGFAAMAQRATAVDFPHVAEYIRVPLPGQKTVKRFAKVDVEPGAFVRGDNGPPLTDEQRGIGAEAPSTGAPASLGF